MFLISLLAYALLLAKNSTRYFQFHKRYDYWIAGYLFDRHKPLIWKGGVLALWLLSLFAAVLLVDALI
jgi:hypothetical protein